MNDEDCYCYYEQARPKPSELRFILCLGLFYISLGKGDDRMLNKLFGKKNHTEAWVSPSSGQVVAIEEVPDPTFSEKMMGDGVAIIPTEGKVVSPVKGKVVQVFPTKHAIGLQSDMGIEILIHVGLETVSLNGEHFNTHVKIDEKVNAGDLLVTFDLEEVKKKAESIITPIIITNGDKIQQLRKELEVEVVAGQTEIASYEVNK